jgi:RNA-directed DNA polymerase
MLRLIGKWLHAGGLAAGGLRPLDQGTPQGGGISPMFANVCLPHVLDEWFVKDVQPRMKGRGFLRRFADAFIIGCELEAAARRGMQVLPKRCSRFRLTMHRAKTGLVEVKKPPSRERSAHSKGTFDCLGFPHYWAQTRRGYWAIKRQTVGKRLRRCRKEIGTWCRENRHDPLKEQDQT